MQIAAISNSMHTAAARPGMPIAVLAGVNRLSGDAAPMQVFSRAMVGRFDGYSSLATAVNAAKRLSKGDDKAAVSITRGSTGMYEVREAVWQLLGGRNLPPNDRAATRAFHFEDGTFSQYSAVYGGRPVQVDITGALSSVTGNTVILVDGTRIIEAA